MLRFLQRRRPFALTPAALVLAISLAVIPLTRAQDQQPAPAEKTASPADAATPDDVYLRVLEKDDGNRIVLEAASREFKPVNGDGPSVVLAAAIHIADRDFYESLQSFLDARDVVLFEGVKPPGVGGDASVQGDEAKAKSTARRIRFLAMAVEAYRREHGKLPADLEQVAAGVPDLPAEMVQRSLKDLWGRAILYSVDPATSKYDITSLGADGQDGGDGPNADLKLSAQKPLSKAEREGGGGGGIQQQMADAMGLTFQLTAMDHTKANWRNSDMSVDQVQQRLEESGEGGEQIFKLLDGSGFFAKALGFFLEIIKSNPSMQTTMKVMMVDMLGRADELMAAQTGAKMMKVLIDDRNAVVIEDLKKVIHDEPGVKTVGIIYGGGHLPDMQRRLRDELGYKPVDVTWRPAIEIDLSKSGTTVQQVRQFREMMKKQLDAQLKRPKKQAKE